MNVNSDVIGCDRNSIYRRNQTILETNASITCAHGSKRPFGPMCTRFIYIDAFAFAIPITSYYIAINILLVSCALNSRFTLARLHTTPP
jgi:hypothetical protein